MSTKIVCDICQKAVDENHYYLLRYYFQSTYKTQKEFDICKACAKPLLKCLKGCGIVIP